MRHLSLLFALTLLITGCGRKGPLIYLDMLVPAAPTVVTARQAGPGMKISFVLPQKDLAGQNLTDLAGVNVFKREATLDQGQECSACSESFRLFRKLYVDIQDGSVRRYGNLMILLDSDMRIGNIYTYKVVPFRKDGLDGASSAQVSATMVKPPLPPALQVFPSPTDIRLEFAGEPPAVGAFMGYNLYRADKGEPPPFLPLNKEPLPGGSYTDSGLDRGVVYSYAARTVVRMPTGEMVESNLSNMVEGALRDEE